MEPLTFREEQILLPVARGRTNSEIADELHISISTVKTHLATLMRKLNARNRVEIAIWAYETGRARTCPKQRATTSQQAHPAGQSAPTPSRWHGSVQMWWGWASPEHDCGQPTDIATTPVAAR